MRLKTLEVNFHRTVRVAEGRATSNLPPSLGRMKLYNVSDYRKNCPEDWAKDACFASLHDTEAMWISFHPLGSPCAILVGAGGVNALTGQKLGTKLEKDNYLVCPPQPWLDGWKDVDGTVHQFVTTPHKKGTGVTVAEQILGEESKTGAIGLAIFEPKEGAKLKTKSNPLEGWTDTAYSQGMHWAAPAPVMCNLDTQSSAKASTTPDAGASGVLAARLMHAEMGLGKGGKIIQKIYTDPHGIEVWKERPTVVFAFYLVDAKTAEEITGEKVNAPVTHTGYHGPWFGLKDEQESDVPGTSIFSGLKSAAFTGDTSNAHEEQNEKESARSSVPDASEVGA
jgi:hypothetical protein